jgi:hypothetical protein
MSDPMPNPNDDAREPNGKLKRKEYEREKLPHSGVELPKRQDRGDFRGIRLRLQRRTRGALKARPSISSAVSLLSFTIADLQCTLRPCGPGGWASRSRHGAAASGGSGRWNAREWSGR